MYTLHLGNCIDILKTISANSIDAVVTDPPYHLQGKGPGQKQFAPGASQFAKANEYAKSAGFMGKKWDGGDIAFRSETWVEVFRVLKPGGHLLAFGGTRTYHRMACAVEDAGFEIRDMISWLYGSGFPKSYNMGKAVDALTKTGRSDSLVTGDGHSRTNNQHWSEFAKSTTQEQFTPESDEGKQWEGWGTALKPACEPIVMARKPLVKGYSVAKNLLEHGTGAINIDGCRVPLQESGEDKRLGGKGSWATDKAAKNVYEGGYAGDDITSDVGGRFPANLIHDGSDEVLEGFPHSTSGAMTAEQQKNGGFKGAKSCYGTAKQGGSMNYPASEGSAARFFYCAKKDSEEGGRFPANLIHDGSDEVLEGFPTSNSARSSGNPNNPKRGSNHVATSYGQGDDTETNDYRDTGSAARFFYCPKASTKDREEGLEGDDKSFIPWFQTSGGTSGKPSSIAKDRKTQRANVHPTVKPTELMRYLCRLITPPGGIVLDPFMGSGSTGKAAVLEGFDFVGIEKEPEYMMIAKKRIIFVAKESEKPKPTESPSLAKLLGAA